MPQGVCTAFPASLAFKPPSEVGRVDISVPLGTGQHIALGDVPTGTWPREPAQGLQPCPNLLEALMMGRHIHLLHATLTAAGPA